MYYCYSYSYSSKNDKPSCGGKRFSSSPIEFYMRRTEETLYYFCGRRKASTPQKQNGFIHEQKDKRKGETRGKKKRGVEENSRFERGLPPACQKKEKKIYKNVFRDEICSSTMSSSDLPDDNVKAEWLEQSEYLKPNQSHVYVLTLVQYDHSGNWGRGPDIEIIGIYDSKAPAVAKSVTVATPYGTFDEAIKDMFEDAHVDNRMNPPDDGILVKIGDDYVGEGDYCQLEIKKQQVEGLQKQASKVAGRKRKAKGRPPQKKKTKSYDSDICPL